MKRPTATRRPSQTLPALFLALMVGSYFLFFATLTVQRHEAFQSTAFDLGIYNQALWNTAHGAFLRSTNEPGFNMLLADHFQPTLLLFVIFYLIHAGPATLLVSQTAILALGALPAYALATRMARPRVTRPEVVGLVFAAVYLLSPALEQANLFDFHPMTLAASFLLYAFYFLRTRRRRLFLLFVILTIGCKEVLPLVGLLLGVYVFLFERERRLGLVTAGLSLLWLYAGLFLIIPHFNVRGQSQYFALHYGQWGNTPFEMARTLLTEPGALWKSLSAAPKPAYLWTLLAPWALTPLAGLPALLPSLPILAVNLLSATGLMHDPDLLLHYAAPLIPVLFIASLDGMAWLADRAASRAWPRERVVYLLTLVVLSATLLAHRQGGETPLAAGFRWPEITPHRQAAQALFAQVLPNEALSASDRLNPHVSGRNTLYVFPRLEDAGTVLYDMTPTNVPLISRDEYDFVQRLIREEGFGVVDGRDGILLLRKGETNRTIPPSFYRFAQTGGVTPQYPTDVMFGDSFALTGFDVLETRPSAPRVYLRLYAQVRRPLPNDLRIFTFLTGEEGKPLPGSEYEIPAAIWYPTRHWPTGETIRLDTLHWELYRHRQFGVALVVTRGDNPWDVESRLPAQIVAATGEAAGRPEGTLLELVHVRRVGRGAEVQPSLR